MEKYINNQSGFVSIVASILGLVVLSGVAYMVMQNTQQPVVEESVAVEIEEDIADVEVQAAESRQSYTTRRRVEVLKSNEQGDPDANQNDFVEAEASEEVIVESAAQGDPNTNRYDFGVEGEASAEANEADAAESSNGLDDNCDSPAGADADCEALDSDDDGDSIPTTESGAEANSTQEQEATTAQNPPYEAN